MAYTVRKVAAMSGISVRTLHFYDETGLLKPAYTRTNGYRFYEEPQLLTLQQILFYRELGFELKQIKRILGRRDFEIVAALRSHREILQKNITRTRALIVTIDKTIHHLNGTRKMKNEEMFEGFTLAAGNDRFGESAKVGEDRQPVDCKVSAKDTSGSMCVFEMTIGWPRHLHHDQDEWIYVLEGKVDFEVGGKSFRVGSGESVFIPRKIPHIWSPADGGAAKVLNAYQPAGKMEEFFRVLSDFKGLPTRDQVEKKTYTESQIKNLHQLFEAYGMDLLGPPLEKKQ